MRVRMLTTLAGIDVVYNHGEEYDLPDDLAERLVAARIAEPVVEEAGKLTRRRGGRVAETASVVPPEEREQ